MEEPIERKGLLAWFASNHVAANLLMLLIVAAGLLSIFTAKMEVFPEFSLDMINISIPYLGTMWKRACAFALKRRSPVWRGSSV